MAGVEFDVSEVRGLAADLTRAGSGIADKVRPVVHRSANNIKRQLRDEMGASESFKGAARDIDYDMTGAGGRIVFGVGVIEAEIGPRSGPGQPGSLGKIAYFGTSRGGGTVPDPQGALDAEAPAFQKALEDVLGGLL